MIESKSGPWLKIKSFYRQYPDRCLCACAAIIVTTGFVWQQHYFSALIMFAIAIQCLISDKSQQRWQQAEFVPDIFTQLKLEQQMLHVKHRQLQIIDIKKVVVDQLDDKEALIDFPFNVYQKLAMRFPASQLPALQAWLKQYLPTAQIIQ